MAIQLPSSTGSILSEYAATTTIINRTVQPDVNNHYNPVFTATINYSRTDYLVDVDGNKTNIIQRTPWVPVQPIPGQPWPQDPYIGSITLTQEQMITLETMVPTVGLLPAIATQEDLFIHADLVTRGLIIA